jgi:uptake hydrogenase large subunit
MTPGGTLAAEVVLRHGIVSEARIVSTRRVPLAAALRGKPVTEAVALLPLLFATCGIAHALAASSAAESAMGGPQSRPPTQGRERAWARRLLEATEIIDGHVWSILIDWPRVFEGSAKTEQLRALRSATAALRDAVDPSRASLGIGSCILHVSRAGLGDALARVEALVSEVVGDLPADAGELGAWAGRSPSPAAPLVRHVLATSSAGVGASDVAPLPAFGAAWFAERLSALPAFGERPTADGMPAEAGPLARAAAAPLVSSVIAKHGRGALARIAARLTELASAPARLRDAADAAEPEEGSELVAHAGCGVADTARGRLAHWALVERGRVVDWRFVAPTEWTFHPDGAFARGLVGSPAGDAERTLRLHVAALDPCVPCEITLRQAESEAP